MRKDKKLMPTEGVTQFGRAHIGGTWK